jgi:pilus assembly protein Flp/PilA
MKSLQRKIWHFLSSEDGPTAVEYAIMLALIIMVCVVSIGSVGQVTSDQFVPVSNALK